MYPGRLAAAAGRSRPLRLVLLLAVTGAAVLASLTSWEWAMTPHRVYSADASVVYLAPVPESENPYTYFPKNAQFVAQTAALEVSSDASRQRLAHGVVEYDARLVDVGSQWVPIHDRPTVEVHVSGANPVDVVAVRSAIVLELTRKADQVQAELGAPSHDRITATSFGLEAPASALGGRRSRALGMLFLLSGACWLAVARLARASSPWRGARSDRTGPDPRGRAEVGHAEELVGIGGTSEDLAR